MSRDFIGIKSLEGDLKISHKKMNYGMTVSTAECVLQKPHVNYHFKLEDIVSVTPFEHVSSPQALFASNGTVGREFARLEFGGPHYRFYVTAVTVHNRSGVFRLGPTELIIPILPDVLRYIAMLGNFHNFD